VGLDNQEDMGLDNFEPGAPPLDEVLMTNLTSMPITYIGSNGEYVVEETATMYLPKWQSNPVLKKDRINVNMYHMYNDVDEIKFNSNVLGTDNHQHTSKFAKNCIDNGKAVLSNFEADPPGTIYDTNPRTARRATLISFLEKQDVPYLGSIIATLYLPVYDSFKKVRKVVGIVTATIQWRQYLKRILPENVEGVIVVMENTCDGYYTFEVNGNEAIGVGFGDLHDPAYSYYNRSTQFQTNSSIVDGSKNGVSFNWDKCEYALHVYPSKVSEASTHTIVFRFIKHSNLYFRSFKC
jgi:hypothetical protein